MTTLTRYQILNILFVSLSVLMLVGSGVFQIVVTVLAAFFLAAFQNIVKRKVKLAGLLTLLVVLYSVSRIVMSFIDF